MARPAKKTLTAVGASLLAVLAAWAVWNYVQQLQREREEGEMWVVVYRATDFIAEGTEGSLVLSQGGAIADETQIKSAPEGAISSHDELEEVLTGRVAAEPIQPDSILTRDQWAEEP